MSTRASGVVLVLVLAILAIPVAADTITVAGNSFVSLTDSNYYNYSCESYCGGVFPHSQTVSTSFTVNLPGLILGDTHVTSASLDLWGLALYNGSMWQNNDLWGQVDSGVFSSITVASVTDSLGVSGGTVTLTDPALLAALSTGAAIKLSGNIGLWDDPTYGNANYYTFQYYEYSYECGFLSWCDVYGTGHGASSQGSFSDYSNPNALLTANTVANAPEPSALMLFGSGLLGVGGVIRRKLPR